VVVLVVAVTLVKETTPQVEQQLQGKEQQELLEIVAVHGA
jgi:hypothetical protein